MSPKPGHRRGKARPRARRPAVVPQTSGAQAAPAAVSQGQPVAPLQRPVPAAARSAGKAPPRLDYVKGDLKRVAITAGGIVAVIAILAVIFR